MVDLQRFFGKKICVAVSGGVDSVTLLHYLKSREKECGYTLSAVHCEHGIRGEESVENAEFVKKLCLSYGVELFNFAEDCIARAAKEKVSLETAARDFRRESFASLAAGRVDFVATAHHAGDAAETVLFRIARGTLSGVKGIEAETGFYIRPILDWTKEEIVRYANAHGLEYREDRTNADLDITRNKLRLVILPKLEEAVPGSGGNLVRFSSLCGEDDRLLYRLAAELLQEENGEYFVAFSEEKPLFRRACLLAMKALGVEKDYTATHLEDAFLLQTSALGARLTLPKGVEAKKTGRGIAFYLLKGCEKERKPENKPFDETGFDGGRYEVKISRRSIESDLPFRTLRIDRDKLPADLVFRFREEGDEIERFGGGTKSMKKFFNEKKIPVEEREYLPLVAKGKEIFLACGVEISEKVKVDKNTQSVLYIAIQKKEK